MRMGRLGILCALVLWGCSGGAKDSAPDIQQSDVSDIQTALDEGPASDLPPAPDGSTAPDNGPSPDVSVEPDVAVEPDVPLVILEHCEGLGLPKAEFNTEGPFGKFRHNLTDDFTFYPLNGDPWTLSENWTGCDVYVFIPNAKPNSQLDATSIWNRDLDNLVQQSPRNVHYFFMATSGSAMASLEAMQERVDNLLATLPESEATFWSERLHVAGGAAVSFPGWLGQAFQGPSYMYGLAIDRHQRLRLNGSFADVYRYNAELNNAGAWPWEANMAYAVHEVRQYNFEALRDAELATQENVTIVTAWEEEEVVFPDAETMAGFDTLEIDLFMDCPDPELGEFGNCGAWDYLSHIYMETSADPQEWTEIARFITTYHREGRYFVDATGLLPYFAEGGTLKLKFDASSQSYRTTMHFRLRNTGKGYRPTEIHKLWGAGGGGIGFGSGYSDSMEDQTVAIPDGAKRVEIWVLLTGHGMADPYNCAEFCNHQHFFGVNGTPFAKTHDMVGDQMGCVTQIENGMVPNQGGTWWFGRGGWCPGQQVDPFIGDATEAAPAGSTATITYTAKLNGQAVPDGSGNMRLSSWLVIYE